MKMVKSMENIQNIIRVTNNLILKNKISKFKKNMFMDKQRKNAIMKMIKEKVNKHIFMRMD